MPAVFLKRFRRVEKENKSCYNRTREFDRKVKRLKITMLGTGHALVTRCYNTCFVMNEGDRYFLVDGGGGNTLLTQIQRAGIPWRQIGEIFVTHKHIDHLLGVIWMLRLICHHMNHDDYEGDVTVYGHAEVLTMLQDIARMLLQQKETRFFGTRVRFIPVTDGEERKVLGCRTVFFDICSTKAKQYGFTMEIAPGDWLTCCGDEPCAERCKPYVKNSKWLLHEAFCLYSQAETYQPYEKHHSTAKDACMLAEECNVANLVLYHTEDDHLPNRREWYTQEGKAYFSGNLFVPDDLDVIEL